jgi:hypothetical protein
MFPYFVKLVSASNVGFQYESTTPLTKTAKWIVHSVRSNLKIIVLVWCNAEPIVINETEILMTINNWTIIETYWKYEYSALLSRI